MKILLITGWGGGTKLLASLKQHLEQQQHNVELSQIFNIFDTTILEQQVEKAKNFDVIMGWSLGGQLATILVDHVEKKYGLQKVLITLGSNPCFVTCEDWAVGMSSEAFLQFKQAFYQDAISTLFKFGFMVCQGVQTTKQDLKTLQSLVQPQNIDELKYGLNCLEQINNVSILQNYTGFQFHIFAKQDFLVSYKVERNFHKFAAKFLETELVSGSHGFPVFQAELISRKICQYLQKINQTYI